MLVDDNIRKAPTRAKSSLNDLVSLSEEQRTAAADISCWLSSASSLPYYLLSGFAGTGKTTLVTALAGNKPGTQFVSYTGKAASVLRRKGASNATTIHRLLYHAPILMADKHGGNAELVWERKDDPADTTLIIADECSMIDQQLGRDLLALRIPLLVTGDPFQLPPIKGNPFFTRKPNYTLTEIHRQAQGSQPLELAVAVHNGEAVAPKPFDRDLLLTADMVIVAFHNTRRRINRLWRRACGVENRYPIVGDQVLCFKTNYASGVLNGELWLIERCDDDGALLHLQLLDDDGREAQVTVPEKHFLLGPPNPQAQDGFDSFDFGYAITAHKAQGSEWNHVVVIDETRSQRFRNMARGSRLHPDEFTDRWLYTAITRAVTRVDVMEPPPP